jgi:hypothetical protein
MCIYHTVVPAQVPPDPGLYAAGVYADYFRFAGCINGPAGSGFEHYVWAWVPNDSGLNYLTLRLAFPDNIDLSRKPVFNDDIIHLEVLDFGAGEIEWTALFDQCPVGWVWICRQECIFMDSETSSIMIIEQYSLARNCQFVIHDIYVLNNLEINDPNCTFVSHGVSSWGAIKRLYQEF